MKRTPFNEMAWLSLEWQRPFEIEAVIDMLTHLASSTPQTPIVFEARGCKGRVRYYLGVDRAFMRIVTDTMRAHGNIRFASVPPNARLRVNEARELKITKPTLSLKTDISEAVIRAGLAALLQPKGNEQAVIQVVLGRSYAPVPTPNHLPDPSASWFKAAFGDVEQATAEIRSVVREKLSSPGFSSMVRLGSTGTKQVAEGHIQSLFSALRTLRSVGVSMQMTTEKVEKLNLANVPWSFPLKLSVKELASVLLFPAGDLELPGVQGLHPKQIMPPEWYRNPFPVHDRTFAHSLDGKARLSISPTDSKTHTVLIGPTGSGKSTAMQQMIDTDILAGRSILLVDPKEQLVLDVLARIPDHRLGDVVIIDPSADVCVGINPLAHNNHSNPGLVADSILAVFQQLWADSWGVRSQDILSAALLTLVQCKGSNLLWLPIMLTDRKFRDKVTTGITDVGLKQFWDGYNAMSDSAQRIEIAPVLNKLRQLTLRSNLRNVLGQSNPKFDLNDLFTKPRIVLVSLNKGRIGADGARLTGSLIVGLTWILALGRTAIPEEKRRLVSIYIDELQDYISSIGKDFSDSLAQARGLGVGITMAHQYREQLPPEIRAGIDSNARNKICFGLQATDAKTMAAMAPGLTADDFQALPQYHVYTSFNVNGRNTGWVSGVTRPLERPFQNVDEIKRKVAARYGKSGAEVEREYLELLDKYHAGSKAETETGPVGRRKKS